MVQLTLFYASLYDYIDCNQCTGNKHMVDLNLKLNSNSRYFIKKKKHMIYFNYFIKIGYENKWSTFHHMLFVWTPKSTLISHWNLHSAVVAQAVSRERTSRKDKVAAVQLKKKKRIKLNMNVSYYEIIS